MKKDITAGEGCRGPLTKATIDHAAAMRRKKSRRLIL
jgi:hypothetical protein